MRSAPCSLECTISRCASEGFRTIGPFVVASRPRSRPARFQSSAGPIEETITVEGRAPLLSPDEASTETRVFHDEIQRLPLNGRGLLALLELSPGANVTPATRGEAGQFTANGQRPNTNYFTVDGMSANTGVSAGGLPAQPSGGALPGHERLRQPGFADAARGHRGIPRADLQCGARREPVAGGGGCSDQPVGFQRVSRVGRVPLPAPSCWRPTTGSRTPPARGARRLRMEDVSPSLGGPIRRDRTFFFLAYERLVLRGPYVWQHPCPRLPSGRRSRFGPSRR